MGAAPALTSMRQELIRAELARYGGVRIRDLMTRLGVSRATVRRDLHALIDAGEAVNARGGVLLPAGRAASGGVAAPDHEAIIEAAARAIMADDVKDLGLFGGPVIHELARHLLDGPQLRVVTNSLAVARILGERPTPGRGARRGLGSSAGFRPQVTLLPGTLHPPGVVLGSLAADALGALHLDATYFDCSGYHAHAGASVDDLYEAALRRLAVQVSDRAVLLVERGLHGAFGLGTFAAPGDLDAIIEVG